MCACICMCVYVCMFVCMFAYVCMCACMYTGVCMYVSVCVYMYVSICVCLFMIAYMLVYVCLYVYGCVQTCQREDFRSLFSHSVMCFLGTELSYQICQQALFSAEKSHQPINQFYNNFCWEAGTVQLVGTHKILHETCILKLKDNRKE